ncbi:hypothetical protein KP509_22G015900 [Ceratopteris richardii]|uniref:Ubiquitin carboxyl-terminal hydrolase n=1 Tax=Ceratopteris richardii TaxID=49495 RepID=A0A8T2S5J9_CERRI|nr:hypothetical protein KP509_22G015900 [Ceratopteris richardii]
MASDINLEMNWLNLQTRKGCPLGLKNLGNSCYLNSVLQCLTYTPPLANFCLLNHHSSSCASLNGNNNTVCLFCVVEKRIARSLSVDSVSESPARIHSCLTLFAKHFRQGWQEDAHEFLRYVIEACNSVCVKLHKILSSSKLRTRQDSQKLLKEEPRTVVKDIFGGVLQSQVKCLSCKAESNKLDEMMDLSLDVFKIASVKEALCRYFQPEVLDGSNKYKCEKCKKLTVARKQMSVSHAPNVLVIQLKRFENFFGGKIDRHITFEEHLYLYGYMCNETKDLKPEYLLYAVIVHSGHSQDSGHYYSYVKDVHGKWFCCNDAHVTSVSAKSVLSEKAYILFYVRQTTKASIRNSVASQNGITTTRGENNNAALLVKPVMKENGVHQNASTASIHTNMSKVDRTPKDSLMKENIPSGASSISLGNSGKDSVVHHVRFTVVKPSTHVHVKNPFSNDKERVSDSVRDREKTGTPKNSGLTNKLPGASAPVSNGNTDIQVNDHENGHCLRKPCLQQKKITEVCSNGEKMRECSMSEVPIPSVDSGTKSGAAEQQNSDHSNDGCENEAVSGAQHNDGVRRCSHGEETGSLESEELKHRLATETREWLLESGWCDTVRSTFRQLKRAHLSQDSDPQFDQRKALRVEVFATVYDSLRQKVPKELKEHLVNQLHVHFRSQRSEEN